MCKSIPDASRHLYLFNHHGIISYRGRIAAWSGTGLVTLAAGHPPTLASLKLAAHASLKGLSVMAVEQPTTVH